MATMQQVQDIRSFVDSLTKTPIDELVTNPKWGTINFENARRDLDLLFNLSHHLKDLPIEIVPDSVANTFIQLLIQIGPVISGIKQFTVEAGSPPIETRDTLVNQAHQFAEQLLVGTQGWIPFLAYQKGDVQKNIEALSKAVKNANEILTQAKQDIEDKNTELTSIINAAREASANAGVAVFAGDFSGQAVRLETEATKWLWATGLFGVSTVIIAFIAYFLSIDKEATNAQIAQYMTSKLLVLLFLFSATIWCGRLFKATKHQAAINKHRANALKTFQAFVKAGGDEQTRNAVLLETTRSIFAIAPSGYIEPTESAPDSGTKILEIIKNVTSGGK